MEGIKKEYKKQKIKLSLLNKIYIKLKKDNNKNNSLRVKTKKELRIIIS